MILPEGRVALDSEDFMSVLNAVHGFHDSIIGCGYLLDPSKQTIFVEMMCFGPEYQYNPEPVLGGMFCFDLPVVEEFRNIGSLYGREISRVEVNRTKREIRFSLQDPPFEVFPITFGARASFQFVFSDDLSNPPLE